MDPLHFQHPRTALKGVQKDLFIYFYNEERAGRIPISSRAARRLASAKPIAERKGRRKVVRRETEFSFLAVQFPEGFEMD